MGLSSDLISQFVKATRDESPSKSESISYGTTVEHEGTIYVKLDGSELLTPVSTTTALKSGERVTVLIKNHTATVTGNLSDPSASGYTVKEIGNQITEFEIVIADKVSTKELDVEKARIDDLVADDVAIKDTLSASNAVIDNLVANNVTIDQRLTANEADIENLETTKLSADIAEITYATIEDLEATNLDVYNLEATYGEFAELTTGNFEAVNGYIKNLEANKLDVKTAEVTYANIDFSNIGSAAIENFYATSGIIKDLVIGDTTITGELVGVTIKGDLIESGTVVADKLVVKGEDGLYYKLNTDGVSVEAEQTEYNSLNGSVITAKSITATKISVDDLVAFDATIGGFKITDDSIYSGVKESIDNTTEGIYLDNTGQMYLGDSNNFLKYYKDQNGNYKLEISAASLSFGTNNTNIETAIGDIQDDITEVNNEVATTTENFNQALANQNTEILENVEDLIDQAGENYVTTDEFEDFRTTTSTQFDILDSGIEMNFTTLTEQISDVDGEMQSKFTELYNYIHINAEDGSMTFGSSENNITLTIENDMIVFKKNGEQFGWWDGTDFHTGNIIIDVTERAQFGNFAFIPRSDGSLSFLKVNTSQNAVGSAIVGIATIE